MAKKDLKSSVTKLDDGLDIPDFNFDDGMTQVKDDRSPISKLTTSTISGATNKIKDTEFLAKTAKSMLPQGYGQAIDLADQAASQGRKLYNNAVKEIKPAIGEFAKAAKTLSPTEDTWLGKRLTNIKDWAADSDSKAPSKDKIREDNISLGLAEVFKFQMEKDAKQTADDNVKDKLEQGVNLVRHKESMNIFGSINRGISALTQYQDKVTAVYQRKSLELQYRSYFVQLDALEQMRKTYVDHTDALKVIAKNTALPEFTKITASERFKDITRNNFYQNIAGNLFKNTNDLVAGISKNLGNMVSEKVGKIKDAFSQGAAGMEMAGTMTDMDLGDEPKESKGMKFGKMAADMAGGSVVEGMAAKAGAWTRGKLDQNKKIGSISRKIQRGIADLPGTAEDFRKGNAGMSYSDTATGNMWNSILEGFKGLMPSMEPDKTIQTDKFENLTDPYIFTKQTHKSINEVIPGYLSRIFRELQVIRTGDEKIELTKYDFTSGKFSGMSKVAQSFLSKVSGKNVSEDINRNVDNLVQEIDNNKMLSPEAKEALKKELTKRSFSGKSSSYKAVTDKDSFITDEAKQFSGEIIKVFQSYFNLDENSKMKDSEDLASLDKQIRFTDRLNNVKSPIKDSRGDIQNLQNLGQQDVLEKLGLINTKDNTINMDRFLEISTDFDNVDKSLNTTQGSKRSKRLLNRNGFNIDRNSKTGSVISSEVNVINQDTQPVPVKIINGIEQINNPENKPTEQPAYKREIDDIIRLVTTGLNNSKEHFQFNKQIIETILAEIVKINERMEKPYAVYNLNGGIGTGSIDPTQYQKVDNSVTGNIKSLMSSGFNLGSKVGKSALNLTKKVGGGIKDAIGSLKNPFIGALKTSTELAGGLVSAAAEKLVRFKDVYIPGEAEPRITAAKMKAGKYFMKAKDGTMKAITSVKDIKDTVYDELGNVVIDKDEIKDIYTKAMIKGKGVITKLGSVLFSGVRGLRDSVGTGFDLAKKAAGFGFSATAKTTNFLLNLLDQPKDIYIKGESTPRLLGRLMAKGLYLSARTGKVIERPSQIDGEVWDDKKQVVLSMDDLRKGILDVDGKEIKTPLMKLKDIAFSGIKKAFKIVNSVGDAVMSKLLGGLGMIGSFFKDGLHLGFGSKKSLDVLTEIRDIIQERLGSSSKSKTKKKLFNTKASTKEDKQIKPKSGLIDKASAVKDKVKEKIEPTKDKDKTKDSTPGLFSKLTSFLSGKKDKVKEQIKPAKEKIAPKFKMGEDKERKGSWRNMPTDRRKINDFTKAKADKTYTGLLGSLGDIMGKIGGLFSGLLGGLGSVGKILGSVVGGLGSVGKLLMSGIGSLLSGKLFGKLGGKLGGSIAGSVAGKGGGMLSKAGGVARAAAGGIGRFAMGNGGLVARAAMVLPMLGTASVAGALGTAGVALGGAAAAVGSVLASPIVLGGAAIAAVGYGGFKAYKFFTKNKLTPLETLRYVQYGFSKDDLQFASKILQFEDLLKDNTAIQSDGTVELSGKDFKAAEVADLFDIDDDDKEQMQKWQYWFENRFRPVYTTHLSALFTTSKKDTLSQVDKMSDKQKLEYFNKVEMKNGPFDEIVPPFKELKFLPSEADQVKAYYKEIKPELEKKAGLKTTTEKVKEGLVQASNLIKDKTSVATNFVKDKAKSGLEKLLGKDQSDKLLDKLSSPQKAWDSFKQGLSNIKDQVGDKISATSTAITKMAGFDITPLDSVRLRAYGLNDMDRLKVIALRNLERVLYEKVKYNADGSVTFTGDTAFVIKVGGTDFGISSTTDRLATPFMNWFNKRFLPVYLNYLAAIKAFTGKADSNTNMVTKNNILLQIAQKIQTLSDIWKVDVSPWAGYSLNTSKSSIDGFVLLLKQRSDQDVVNEQKAKKVETLMSQNKDNKAKEDKSKQQADDKANAPVNSNLSMFDSGDHEEIPTKDSTSVSVSKERINFSKPKVAGGPILGGERAKQYINLASAEIDINNLHPTLAKNLFGMIEEYGTLTGKKVTINSGYRSYEKQKALYEKDPLKVAKPGSSLHESGLAVDINSGDLDALDRIGLMKKYGFTRPVGGETWHMEPAGLGLDIAGAKKDPNRAKQLIESSVGRGGGGYGSIKGTNMGKRNADMAKRIYDLGGEIPEEPIDMGQNSPVQVQEPLTAKTKNDTVAASTAPGASAKDNLSSEGGMMKTSAPASGSPSSSGGSSGSAALVGGGGYGSKKGASLSNSADSENSKTSDVKAAVPGGNDKASKIPDATGKGLQAVGPTIEAAAKTVGVDPEYMKTIAGIESGFDPSAKASTSSASGLFQFISSSWNEMLQKFGPKYNLAPDTSPFDAKANSLLGGELIKLNANAIKSVKPDVNPVDVYMAHFLGAGGAKNFFSKDPTTDAASAMPAAAKANKNIFFKPTGSSRSVGEVYDVMKNKVEKTSSQLGLKVNIGGAQLSSSGTNKGTVTKTASDAPTDYSLTTRSDTSSSPSTKSTDLTYKDSAPKDSSQTALTSGSYSKPKPSLNNTNNPQTQTGGFTSVVQPAQSDNSMAESAISSVSSTLSKSLNVQTEILNILKQMSTLSQAGASEKTEDNKANAMKKEELIQQTESKKDAQSNLETPIGPSKDFSREPTPLKRFPVSMSRTI